LRAEERERRPLPPGPRGLHFLSGIPGLVRDPLAYLRRVAGEHGGVVSLSPYGRRIYLVVDPGGVQHVLSERAERYQKHELTRDRMGAFLGRSVVVTEGAEWRRQRRQMQPSFDRARLDALAPLMADAASRAVATWEPTAFDLGEKMKALTLAIASRGLFGQDLSGEAAVIAPAVQVAQEHVARRMRSFTGLVDRALPLLDGRFRQARAAMDEVVARAVRDRRRAPAGDDLLCALLAVRDEESGAPLDEAEIQDQVRGLLVAGFESTATVLTWSFYLLARNPAVARQLEEEVDTVLAGRAPSREDLPRLRLARRTFEETLRLYPPVWMTLRTPLEDDEVSGFRLPAGSLVLLSPYVTQRHPAWWPDPDRFDPGRFTPEASRGRPRFATFPFGGGPRVCLGAAFALMEAQVILATVAQRLRLELADAREVEVNPLATLQPRAPITMRAVPRACASS
jgi:cytochrome P450